MGYPPANFGDTKTIQTHSLLCGTSAANIHKLQCAQNSLSRVVLSDRHREHLSASIGPASYVVNAGDLQAVTPGNLMIKFADDTYIIIPPISANSRLSELDNVEL